jgi:hypothetical protein
MDDDHNQQIRAKGKTHRMENTYKDSTMEKVLKKISIFLYYFPLLRLKITRFIKSVHHKM